jgi:hypothetical protein
MQVSVTAKHIAAASTFPYTSPVALAIGGGAIANHCAVYVNGERFELPAIAKQKEIEFDYFKNRDKEQGKHLEAIKPYEFELCAN